MSEQESTLDEFISDSLNGSSQKSEKKLKNLVEKDEAGVWGDEPNGDGVKVLRATNYGENKIDLSDVAVRDIPDSKKGSKQLEPGDIVVERSGGSADQPVGRVLFFDLEGEYYHGNFLRQLRPKTSEINSLYLYNYLDYDYKRGGTKPLQTNTTNIRNLQYSSYLNQNIPVPLLSEQRKIASVLHTVSQTIKKTEEIIEQIERSGKGLRQTLFSEGYNNHETESYGTLGEVPSDWEKTRLYKVADVARGKFTHRPRNDPEFYDGEYPFIQTGEVVASVGELTDYSQTLNEKGRNVSKEFAPGTIIITIAGNIGDTAVATFPVYFPDSLVGITPNEDMNEYFLEHYFRYRQNFLNRLSTKTTQKNLNLTLLRPIEVVKPPLKEQNKIARVLTSVDNRIKKERQYKKQLSRFKQGLMQDLLSGTVRTTDTNIQVPDEVAQYG